MAVAPVRVIGAARRARVPASLALSTPCEVLSKMAAPWPPAERAWLKTAAEGLPQEAFERVVAAAFGRDVAALRRWAVEDVFAGRIFL